MEFFEALDAGITGGIIGLIGGFAKQIMGFFERKNEREHELKTREFDLKQTQLESESAQKLAEIERQTQTEVADTKAFQASLVSDGIKYYDGSSKLLEWLDFLRGFNRILLTWLLLIGTMIIYFTINDVGMKIVIVKALVMLTCTAIGWWFGERPLKKLQL